MTAPSSRPDSTARELADTVRDNALSLLRDRDGEQWIEPHEITDRASPDLIAARDVLALLAQVERLEALVARSLNWEEYDKALTERAGWLREQLDRQTGNAAIFLARAETAERQLAEAREALRKIASCRCLNSKTVKGSCDWGCVVCTARAALAATEREA